MKKLFLILPFLLFSCQTLTSINDSVIERIESRKTVQKPEPTPNPVLEEIIALNLKIDALKKEFESIRDSIKPKQEIIEQKPAVLEEKPKIKPKSKDPLIDFLNEDI